MTGFKANIQATLRTGFIIFRFCYNDIEQSQDNETTQQLTQEIALKSFVYKGLRAFDVENLHRLMESIIRYHK